MDQYTLQQEQLARRRKVAEAMLAQSMQPMGDTQMVGGIAVRRSPLEGLAKVAQALSARGELDSADKDARALVDTQRADMADAVAQYTRGTTARPASSEQIVDEQALGGEGAPATITAPAFMPTRADNRREAITLLGRIGDPREAGKLLVAEALRKADLKYQDLGDAIGVFDESGTLVQRIPKAATPDARLKEAGSDRRHETPSGGAILGANVTMRGQDMTDSRTRAEGAANRGVSMRGQDMTDARSRESIAQGGRSYDAGRGVIVNTRDGTAAPVLSDGKPLGADPTKTREDLDNLRKEFEARPSVKSYRDILPIAASAQKVPDTRAGDIQMAYAVGKILDPNSVVREGELKLVGEAATVMGKIEGQLRTLALGKGRLTPQTRAELNAMLSNALGERKAAYDAERGSFEGIVSKRGYDPKDVFVNVQEPVTERRGMPSQDAIDAELRRRRGGG